MNTLLVFFALPVATILISIVLEKILKSPSLVSTFVFAVYLIVTFAVFDESFLVETIIYTILAFVTSIIVKIISNFIVDYEGIYECNSRNGLGENNIRNRASNTRNSSNNDIIDNDVIIDTKNNTNINAKINEETNRLEDILNNRKHRRV